MRTAEKHQLLDELNDIGNSLSIWDDTEIIRSREDFFHSHIGDHISHLQSAVRIDFEKIPECRQAELAKIRYNMKEIYVVSNMNKERIFINET